MSDEQNNQKNVNLASEVNAVVRQAGERETTLEEWCSSLPDSHGVNKQLKCLQHCREHPFKWAFWDLIRHAVPFVRWKSPIA